MGKTSISGICVPRPNRSFYGYLYAYASKDTKPDNFVSGNLIIKLPMDFSPIGKRVEIWARNPPMYHRGYPTAIMCSAYSFQSEVEEGIVYSGTTEIYPNGGSDRGYLQYKILSPLSYGNPSSEQIMSPYPEACAVYYIPIEYKAWRSGGFYDISVFFRFDFYDN